MLIFTLLMNLKVIGTVGRIGSGKDEALKYLKVKYGIPYLSTGDIVRQIAAKEGMAPTRENLDEISTRYFAEYGRGCFVRMAAGEIKKRGWQVAGISGIRAPEDVRVLKDMFGDNFITVLVEVKNPELRFSRVHARHEGRDPASYREFQAQDRREEEIFHVSETAGMANYTLANDGTLEDFHRQIDELVLTLKLIDS